MIPSIIRAGDTVIWTDEAFVTPDGRSIDSGDWTLTYYLRFNSASEGATVTGVAEGLGWKTTIASATSAGFDAGTWFFQAVASSGSEKFTVREGSFEVKASMIYASDPGAFDGRSQTEKDLAAVKAAIRSMIEGGAVAEYTIGNRSLKKLAMTDLLELESRLKYQVAREKKSEKIKNGLGNPHSLYVRFRG